MYKIKALIKLKHSIINFGLFNLNQTYHGKTSIKQNNKGSKLLNRRKISIRYLLAFIIILEMKQQDIIGLNKKRTAMPIGLILQHSTFFTMIQIELFKQH